MTNLDWPVHNQTWHTKRLSAKKPYQCLLFVYIHTVQYIHNYTLGSGAVFHFLAFLALHMIVKLVYKQNIKWHTNIKVEKSEEKIIRGSKTYPIFFFKGSK